MTDDPPALRDHAFTDTDRCAERGVIKAALRHRTRAPGDERPGRGPVDGFRRRRTRRR